VLVGETPWRFKSSPGHHRSTLKYIYINALSEKISDIP